jgi:tetratricopeptide (TPR) repeat protein
MNWLYRILILTALAGALLAQRHQLTINTETPEGQLLQQIGQEAEAPKKVALMEEFIQKFPKHEGAAWVLEQLLANYLKANQHDKALASGEKLLAIDPDDVATAHNCLKAAEGKKDADLIVKWAGATSKAARKVAAAPKPSDEDEVESWKRSVDYAKQVDTYTEYSLYATALASTEPATKIMLYDALEAQNPQSQYLPQLIGQYFVALRQTGANDKAIAVAEKVLEKDQTNEDMLLSVADSYFNKKANPDKVIEYSLKLAELMNSKPRPEGVGDADWDKRKKLLTGLGYWLAGVTYGGLNKFKETDANLRLALPLVEGNDALKAQALFWLGLANYRLGEPAKDKKRMAEALRFNVQCAAIKSPFAAQANKNAMAIRQQYGLK